MKEFWNERYGADHYIYGTQPNQFLAEHLPKLIPGKILFPAEGEGRNAVYAARLGWEAFAFDYSSEGQRKAQRLAIDHNVEIQYTVEDLFSIKYKEETFDAIAMIYAHFPDHLKTDLFEKVKFWLKPGGSIIFEGFSKNQLKFNSVNPKSGGPKVPELLYSIQDIRNNFGAFETIVLEETTIINTEGSHHSGEASVVRFVGKKLK